MPASKSIVFENHPILARQAPATAWDAKLCDQALSHDDRYAAGARSGLRVGVESETTGSLPEQFLGDCDVRAVARVAFRRCGGMYPILSS